MQEQPEKTSTVWASVGATINTGEYNNIKVDLGYSLAGVPVGASKEEVEERAKHADETLEIVFENLSNKLIEKATELRQRDADTR